MIIDFNFYYLRLGLYKVIPKEKFATTLSMTNTIVALPIIMFTVLSSFLIQIIKYYNLALIILFIEITISIYSVPTLIKLIEIKENSNKDSRNV